MKRDISVFKLFVPDDGTSIEFLRDLRWEDGVYCPRCRSFKITKQGRQGKTRRQSQIRRYKCKKCKLKFNDLTGTIFAKKKLPLGEMLYILANLDKKSVKRFSEELSHKRDGITRLSREFRENLAKNTPDPILSGEVEIDEMYIHAGNKGIKKTPNNLES